jgi:hypothetical protein
MNEWAVQIYSRIHSWSLDNSARKFDSGGVDCGSTECEATVAQYIKPCIGSKGFCVWGV